MNQFQERNLYIGLFEANNSIHQNLLSFTIVQNRKKNLEFTPIIVYDRICLSNERIHSKVFENGILVKGLLDE